jgi:hypothetical protein
MCSRRWQRGQVCLNDNRYCLCFVFLHVTSLRRSLSSCRVSECSDGIMSFHGRFEMCCRCSVLRCSSTELSLITIQHVPCLSILTSHRSTLTLVSCDVSSCCYGASLGPGNFHSSACAVFVLIHSSRAAMNHACCSAITSFCSDSIV